MDNVYADHPRYMNDPEFVETLETIRSVVDTFPIARLFDWVLRPYTWAGPMAISDTAYILVIRPPSAGFVRAQAYIHSPLLNGAEEDVRSYLEATVTGLMYEIAKVKSIT